MTPEQQDRIRKEYAHLDTLYFNSAYFGPSPYSAKQKIANATFKELDPSFYPYQTWMGVPDRMRILVSKVLNCCEDNIMFHSSTSDIVNVVAQGMNIKKGESVVALKGEYPSNVLPWMLASKQRGFELNMVDCPLPTPETLAKVFPKNTKVFNCSYVAFDSGRKINLLEVGKFLKERDIIFIVDVTQGLGGLNITPEEMEVIDILACSSYKWMLGPYGHAFGYFSDEAIKWVEMTEANWVKSTCIKNVNKLTDYTLDPLPGARKFDRGQTANMLVNACFEAGLEFLLDIGLADIEKHNTQLRKFFLEHYPKSKYDIKTPLENCANIIALNAHKGDVSAIERELKHDNIDISVREGKMRLSFHLFNTQDQVERLIKCLDA